MRARSTPSSNSLMLPFIPSSRRSFGRIVDSVQINYACIDFAAQLEQPIQSGPLRDRRDASRQSTAPT